ncbi:MAG: SRPBCC family protein [Acidobacteria bacterium]|nr:SRPBCC family protein [Acidobacteriota bacterium]
MFKSLMYVLLAIVAVLAVLISQQPSSYSVARSAIITATPQRVFALVNDYHKWEGWSPWAKLDPNMKTTYSGAQSGTGAVYHWTGNDDVGEGEMRTLESRPCEYVKIDLVFIKPFASRSLTEFKIRPEGTSTLITWEMSGEANFMSKAFSVIKSMDAMIGPDFEKGLAQMKKLAETQP